MAKWTKIRPNLNDGERKVAEWLRDHLPDDYQIFSSVNLYQNRKNHDVDILVLAPHGLYVVEVKRLSGKITGNAVNWKTSDGYQPPENPLMQAEDCARILRGKISRYNPQFNPFLMRIQSCVCLVADEKPDWSGIKDDPARLSRVWWYKELQQYITEPNHLPHSRQNDRSIKRFHESIIKGIQEGFWIPSDIEGYKIIGRAWSTYIYDVFSARKDNSVYLLKVYDIPSTIDRDQRETYLKDLNREFQALMNVHRSGDPTTGGKNFVISGREAFLDDEMQHLIVVTEPAEGKLLESFIHNSRLSILEKYKIAARICRGLSYIHSADIIHRNISPTSIVLSKDGTTKIVDFDYAKFSADGSTKGTVNFSNLSAASFVIDLVKRRHYTAPELLAVEEKVDKKYNIYHRATKQTDIYALGITLWELFTGQLHNGGKLRLDQLENIDGITKVVKSIIEGMTGDIDRRKNLRLEDIAAMFERLGEGLPVEERNPIDFHSGYVFGNYRIEHKIVETNMSFTYVAVEPPTNTKVIIKFLCSASDKANNEMARASTILQKLDTEFTSKWITGGIQYYKNGKYFNQQIADGTPIYYQVLEYIEGNTIKTLIDQGNISADQVKCIGQGIFEAVHAVHQAGWFHRDIKPENIIVTQDGNVKLVDFGLSRQMDDDTYDTSISPGYVAPELLPDPTGKGAYEWTAQADIYAAACVMVAMLCGESKGLISEPIFGWDEVRSKIGLPITEVLECATQRNPELRYESAENLLGAYEQAMQLANEPISENVEEETELDINSIQYEEIVVKLKKEADEFKDQGKYTDYGKKINAVNKLQEWLDNGKEGECPIDIAEFVIQEVEPVIEDIDKIEKDFQQSEKQEHEKESEIISEAVLNDEIVIVTIEETVETEVEDVLPKNENISDEIGNDMPNLEPKEEPVEMESQIELPENKSEHEPEMEVPTEIIDENPEEDNSVPGKDITEENSVKEEYQMEEQKNTEPQLTDSAAGESQMNYEAIIKQLKQEAEELKNQGKFAEYGKKISTADSLQAWLDNGMKGDCPYTLPGQESSEGDISVSRGRGQINALIERALNLSSEEEFDEALSLLDEALELDSENGEIQEAQRDIKERAAKKELEDLKIGLMYENDLRTLEHFIEKGQKISAGTGKNEEIAQLVIEAIKRRDDKRTLHGEVTTADSMRNLLIVTEARKKIQDAISNKEKTWFDTRSEEIRDISEVANEMNDHWQALTLTVAERRRRRAQKFMPVSGSRSPQAALRELKEVIILEGLEESSIKIYEALLLEWQTEADAWEKAQSEIDAINTTNNPLEQLEHLRKARDYYEFHEELPALENSLLKQSQPILGYIIDKISSQIEITLSGESAEAVEQRSAKSIAPLKVFREAHQTLDNVNVTVNQFNSTKEAISQAAQEQLDSLLSLDEFDPEVIRAKLAQLSAQIAMLENQISELDKQIKEKEKKKDYSDHEKLEKDLAELQLELEENVQMEAWKMKSMLDSYDQANASLDVCDQADKALKKVRTDLDNLRSLVKEREQRRNDIRIVCAQMEADLAENQIAMVKDTYNTLSEDFKKDKEIELLTKRVENFFSDGDNFKEATLAFENGDWQRCIEYCGRIKKDPEFTKKATLLLNKATIRLTALSIETSWSNKYFRTAEKEILKLQAYIHNEELSSYVSTIIAELSVENKLADIKNFKVVDQQNNIDLRMNSLLADIPDLENAIRGKQQEYKLLQISNTLPFERIKDIYEEVSTLLKLDSTEVGTLLDWREHLRQVIKGTLIDSLEKIKNEDANQTDMAYEYSQFLYRLTGEVEQVSIVSFLLPREKELCRGAVIRYYEKLSRILVSEKKYLEWVQIWEKAATAYSTDVKIRNTLEVVRIEALEKIVDEKLEQLQTDVVYQLLSQEENPVVMESSLPFVFDYRYIEAYRMRWAIAETLDKASEMFENDEYELSVKYLSELAGEFENHQALENKKQQIIEQAVDKLLLVMQNSAKSMAERAGACGRIINLKTNQTIATQWFKNNEKQILNQINTLLPVIHVFDISYQGVDRQWKQVNNWKVSLDGYQSTIALIQDKAQKDLLTQQLPIANTVLQRHVNTLETALEKLASIENKEIQEIKRKRLEEESSPVGGISNQNYKSNNLLVSDTANKEKIAGSIWYDCCRTGVWKSIEDTIKELEEILPSNHAEIEEIKRALQDAKKERHGLVASKTDLEAVFGIDDFDFGIDACQKIDSILAKYSFLDPYMIITKVFALHDTFLAKSVPYFSDKESTIQKILVDRKENYTPWFAHDQDIDEALNKYLPGPQMDSSYLRKSEIKPLQEYISDLSKSLVEKQDDHAKLPEPISDKAKNCKVKTEGEIEQLSNQLLKAKAHLNLLQNEEERIQQEIADGIAYINAQNLEKAHTKFTFAKNFYINSGADDQLEFLEHAIACTLEVEEVA